MDRVRQTFTITATEDTMRKFQRFLAFLHFNGGHSGLFAMGFDGDGHEYFNVKGGLPDRLRRGNRISTSGATIEVAEENSTEGWFVNYDCQHWDCDAAGNLTRIDPDRSPPHDRA